MGATTYKPKKATFTVVGKGNKRVFTAVNRRAKVVARKAGKRTKVTTAELQALKNSGTYRYFAYASDGTLKRVRV